MGSITLNKPYPFPYGFILATTTEDGDNVDCIVFTQKKLHTNTIIECHPVGLLELFEDGETDHKVIGVLSGEQFNLFDEALDSVRRFYNGISKQFPTKEFNVGDLLPVEKAIDFVRRSSNGRKVTS